MTIENRGIVMRYLMVYRFECLTSKYYDVALDIFISFFQHGLQLKMIRSKRSDTFQIVKCYVATVKDVKIKYFTIPKNNFRQTI